MRIKMNTLGVAVALAVSGAAQAGTAPIQFDYNGTDAGGVITVSSFDWSQDNALAVGAVPISTDPTSPNTFTLYAQASLGNFKIGDTVITGTGLNSDYEITVQTGFTEIGVADIDYSTFAGLGGAEATFVLASTQTVNFFNIYYDTAMNADMITGTGYGDGDLILSGVVIGNTTTFFVPFNIDTPITDTDGDGILDTGDGIFDTPTTGLLDNQGSDDQNGTQTVYGNGGGALQADVTWTDGNYFLSDIVSLILNLEFNTSTITPFSEADPSDAVVGNVPVYGNLGGVPTNGFTDCGSVNPPCDFHFQADANQAFYVSVPEPGSLLLLGAGLMGMGWVARRRKA